MDRRIAVGVMLLILLLVVVMGILVADQFIEGNRVTIYGTVSNNAVTGWSVDIQRYTVEKDALFDITFWYMPWETKDVEVVATLTSGGGSQYIGSSWVGRGNVIYSNLDFSVAVHYVPKGQYQCTIVVYEVDKGFFGIFEENRDAKVTKTITVDVR